MTEKTVCITSANGAQRVVSVLETTTVREILQQFDDDSVEDRQATLLHGVTRLEPDMTVSEAALGDEEDLSLVWFDPFVEMERWTGEKMEQNLYVRIPPHITCIELAFHGCQALVKVVIPDSVTSIGFNAFGGCSSLTQVEIPNSVTSIETRAFQGCSSLTEVKIPDSVTKIGDRAFDQCISLTQVNFPESVTRIGIEAFLRCSSLTEATYFFNNMFFQLFGAVKTALPELLKGGFSFPNQWGIDLNLFWLGGFPTKKE